jgi:translocation and assembly module TamA
LKREIVLLLLLLPLLLFAKTDFKYVEISGNKILKKSFIYENLGLTLPRWYEFWKEKRAKVNPKIIPSLQESLENLYRSEGFYHTRINKEEDNRTVLFKINEGPYVKVNSIEIKSDYPIKDLITFKRGDRFRANKFVAIKKAIKEKMLMKGYCNFDLDTKAYVDIKKDSVDLKYRLKSNVPCFFGLINIHPPKGISKRVVRSRILFRSGDPYSLDKVNKTYSTLSGLEAFDGIQLQTRKKDNRIDTDITLYAKQKPTRREIGIGYETNYGFKTFLHWNRKNFKGDAKKLSFDLKYSQKERLFKNGFFWPALVKVPGFDYYLDFKNSFSYSKITYENFSEEKVADKVHLLTDHDWFSVDTGVGLEYIKIRKFKNICNISEGDFLLFYPYAELIFDLRDSKIDPKNGFYISQYIEGGLQKIISEITYAKGIFEGRAIRTWNRFTFAAKARLGLLKEYAGRLPESKLFYAGGAFSNRAYGYNRLGAFDAACGDIGGRTLVDNTLEVSHPIYKNIDLALFWDSTMISAKRLNFNLDFKNAVGTGLRYNTVIGPIKFDVGFSLEDRNQYAIHFQIGQSY